MKLRQTDYLLLFVLALAVGSMVRNQPGPGPGPEPEPTPQPVDSPFPAEGFWLLVASESSDLSPATMVTTTEAVRKEPGLNARWCDYDKPTDEPWNAALQYAKNQSQGQPYYVIRHGSKASSGPLPGKIGDIHATITAAIGEAR